MGALMSFCSAIETHSTTNVTLRSFYRLVALRECPELEKIVHILRHVLKLAVIDAEFPVECSPTNYRLWQSVYFQIEISALSPQPFHLYQRAHYLWALLS